MGTLNYMSPEMLKSQVSTLENDLWALGCIIFKMATGRVPFPGLEMYDVKPKVLSREITWPTEPLDPDCQDLIEKLLQLKPKDRLGAVDTEHDIIALMDHPFFEDIDFNADLTKLGLRELLGETDPAQSNLEGFATSPGVLPTVAIAKRSSSAALAASYLETTYGDLQSDRPLLSGLLIKKNRYFMYQERRFELFIDGRIKYYHLGKEKGMLTLTKESKARKVGRREA